MKIAEIDLGNLQIQQVAEGIEDEYESEFLKKSESIMGRDSILQSLCLKMPLLNSWTKENVAFYTKSVCLKRLNLQKKGI